MRDFDLLLPTNLGQALDALAAGSANTRPLAGGTDMIVDVRARRAQPDTLVSLQQVSELRGVARHNGTIRIGAATTIAEFLHAPLLLEHARGAQRAAAVFANPLIRNLATVAGNIGSASPAGDMLPPLLALDAQVELVSPQSTRTLALDDFFLGPRKTARQSNELLTAISIPARQPNTGEAFYKLGLRQADAISLVSVAVWLRRDGERVQDVRVALGAVAPRPLRAVHAEQVLRGSSWSDALVGAAAQAAAADCSPIDDLRATAAYRQRMVQVLVRRMLREAWQTSRA